MSAVISALDAHTVCRGENGHVQHTWTTEIQEAIVQLFFQLVRTDAAGMDALCQRLDTLLRTLKERPPDPMGSEPYLLFLYRMLAHTRDVVSGKGEYALAYRMLLVWHGHFPELAERALETWVRSEGPARNEGRVRSEGPERPAQQPCKLPEGQPYGSWKDIKYVAEYVKTVTQDANHPLIQAGMALIQAQLAEDMAALGTEDIGKVSLCAKWVPREPSRFGWLFRRLAESTCVTDASHKSRKQAYKAYRTMLSQLNAHLDTVQVKQCGGYWAYIDHHKTTSITLSRNRKAFMNLTKKGEQRSEDPDRVTCAQHFKAYLDQRIKTGGEVKGRNVGLNDFTRQAIQLLNQRNNADREQEVAVLNAQWASNGRRNPHALTKIVAMVDTSGSMEGDPLWVAIALGIRVAETSLLGPRVLTFNTTPAWHRLDTSDGFVAKVDHLRRANWGGTTDFYAALRLILEALQEQQVPPAETEGLVLAIFSDMQINQADSRFGTKDMQETVAAMYAEAGYPCPHLLFWNLRHTDGFPCLSTVSGASMMSGFSPSLLNAFCEQGAEALQQATPWQMLVDTLNVPRYQMITVQ